MFRGKRRKMIVDSGEEDSEVEDEVIQEEEDHDLDQSEVEEEDDDENFLNEVAEEEELTVQDLEEVVKNEKSFYMYFSQPFFHAIGDFQRFLERRINMILELKNYFKDDDMQELNFAALKAYIFSRTHRAEIFLDFNFIQCFPVVDSANCRIFSVLYEHNYLIVKKKVLEKVSLENEELHILTLVQDFETDESVFFLQRYIQVQIIARCCLNRDISMLKVHFISEEEYDQDEQSVLQAELPSLYALLESTFKNPGKMSWRQVDIFYKKKPVRLLEAPQNITLDHLVDVKDIVSLPDGSKVLVLKHEGDKLFRVAKIKNEKEYQKSLKRSIISVCLPDCIIQKLNYI